MSDALRFGRALKALRNSLDLTQEQASAAMEPEMTTQYWGMHETGKVPKIFRPSHQRNLIAALNRAGRPDPPLTVADLTNLTAEGAEAPNRARKLDLPDSGGREAVFPTRDGPVVVRYPDVMTADGIEDLGAYFAVLLKTLAAG